MGVAGTRKAIATLIEHLKNRDKATQWLVAQQLKMNTKEVFGYDQAKWEEWFEANKGG